MPNKQCEQNENPIDIILPLKEINDSAHKKKLQKKNKNKKNQKKEKIK